MLYGNNKENPPVYMPPSFIMTRRQKFMTKHPKLWAIWLIFNSNAYSVQVNNKGDKRLAARPTLWMTGIGINVNIDVIGGGAMNPTLRSRYTNGRITTVSESRPYFETVGVELLEATREYLKFYDNPPITRRDKKWYKEKFSAARARLDAAIRAADSNNG